jgi:Kef-type K+ transport system membrane component KefB
LILLVLEAGIDIDVSTLKLIGTRGFLIAVVGSILPIGIATSLALALNGTGDVKAAIAAGASFAPTSLGIALNILRAGGILNTPVGQLIISAAVIDDMIALIILSQLESLSGTIDAASILIPIVSAFCFLIVGGYVSLFIIPPLLKAYVLPRFDDAEHGRVEMIVMFAFLLGMMPATYYAKASYLMGAFVTGLAFCTSHELHVTFVRQFKRILQWLMRIFFAASIGFQVPIKDFADGVVIYQGLLFALALLGKLTVSHMLTIIKTLKRALMHIMSSFSLIKVGFMVPNFTQSRSFTELHLRDCLITGFSMAAEGEFAFVIAVFSVDSGLISEKLYASVVLAILISTVIPPFALRFTISYYNRRAEKMIEKIANDEMERNHLLEGEESLVQQIQLKRAVFLCIQTQSLGRWGLMHELMSAMAKLGLDVIDHRAWRKYLCISYMPDVHLATHSLSFF